jgi:pimeloyl-ACP methyl ester carboxylesterase
MRLPSTVITTVLAAAAAHRAVTRAPFSPAYETLTLPSGANLSCLFAGMPWSPDAPVATPVILFLHGWPEGSWAWANVMASGLLDDFVLAAPDQRGYNQSSLMPTYELDALVADATALAAALARSGAGAARPVHWVAHDWGGAVAWAAAAADDAGAIASLTIINMAHPVGWISEIRTVAAQQAASAYVLSFVNPAFPAFAAADDDAFLKSVFSSEPWWPAAQAAYAASWAVDGTVNASLGWYRENVRPHCNLSCTSASCWKEGADSSFDDLAHSGVTRESLRVRVLWGLLDTAFDNAGQLAFMHTVVRGPLNISTFPDNGHWLVNEAPRDVAAAIAAFVVAS